VSCLQAHLPFPYLRCQDTCSAPSPVPCLVLHLCLPSHPPPWAYWDPGLPWKTHTMVPYNFLKLFPHIICQTSQSKAALNQLLGTRRGKSVYRKLQQCHTGPNSALTRGGGKINRHTLAQGCWPLGAAVTPAITKIIHREGLACIQSCQPYTEVTVTHCHSPKMDERKNKCTQAHVHGEGVE
jgi:hypothetical protein